MLLKWPWTLSDSDSPVTQTPTRCTLFYKQFSCVLKLAVVHVIICNCSRRHLLTLHFNALSAQCESPSPSDAVNHAWPLWRRRVVTHFHRIDAGAWRNLIVIDEWTSWLQCLGGVAWEAPWFRRQVRPVATITSPTCITFYLTMSLSCITRHALTYKKKSPFKVSLQLSH